MKNKFKVGDRVKISKAWMGHSFYWDPAMNAFIGSESEVVKIASTSTQKLGIYCLKNNGWVFSDNNLELVSEWDS